MGQEHVKLRTVIASAGWIVALLTIPLVVNLVMWRTLVIPQRQQLQILRDEQRLDALRPTLERLLAESRRMLKQVEAAHFTTDDPTAVMQLVQWLAQRHHVQIKDLSAQGQSQRPTKDASPRLSTLPIELAVTGRFSKLAHWLSDMESQVGLQVDAWTLTSGKEPDAAHQLTVHLTAFLEEA